MAAESETLAPALAEREQVLRILREAAPRLRARGITRLSLFGSMARGKAGPKSDIDLLIEVDAAARFSLSDLLDLQEELGDILGRPINFAFASEMRPWLREWIEDDRIGVFLMADKTPRLYLEHIREATGLIEQYARGRQRPDLDRDPMLRQAIERNIEIISEASRRLPAAMKARHPEVPWRDIAAIGNILRHEYPAVNRDIIWRIATEDIRPLAAAMDALMGEGSGDRSR
jgi:hypothetical protein